MLQTQLLVTKEGVYASALVAALSFLVLGWKGALRCRQLQMQNLILQIKEGWVIVESFVLSPTDCHSYHVPNTKSGSGISFFLRSSSARRVFAATAIVFGIPSRHCPSPLRIRRAVQIMASSRKNVNEFRCAGWPPGSRRRNSVFLLHWELGCGKMQMLPDFKMVRGCHEHVLLLQAL